MIPKFNAIVLSIAMTFIFFNSAFSQGEDAKSEKTINRRYAFFNLRGSNAVDAAAGSLMVEGDSPKSEFALYFRIGYKRHLTSHLNINFTFNKYDVVIKEDYNEGFMSFDLNLEFLFSPSTKFTPFIYAGAGYNASNYFVSTAYKAQGGIGFEFMVVEGVGLKLLGEYNYMLTDEIDGIIEGNTDDVLLRMGLGLNIYFGGNKKKEALRRKMKTVINSNLIIPYN